MSPLFGKCVWLLGVIGWFIIRYPYDRRARKTPKVKSNLGLLERALLAISTCGLGVIPIVYLVGPIFAFADYRFSVIQFAAGTLVFAYGLWLFRRTHKDLGRNWSVTLEVRDQHKLVTNGVYDRVRHPMYAAFWLWAVAQALLLPNWIAGLSGLIGFGTLFFFRVGREEQMMTETFGDEYRAYMQRTARILPGVY